MSKIFLIGMWHLGCVNAGCLNKLGHDVTCFDFDKKVIKDLQNGILPIYETGLKELFDDRIHYSTNIKDAENSDFVFITYDISANGIELDIIDKIIEKLKPHIKNQIIVLRSQVTIGISNKICSELNCEVCYMPENIKLGTALHTFFQPDWLIFGLSSDSIKDKVISLFDGIDTTRICLTLKEAEMAKVAMNCYLATIISLAGEISDICENNEINAQKVISAIKWDKRISPFAPINPGLGFSGATINRDVKSAIKLGGHKVIRSVYFYNKKRRKYVFDRLESLLGDLKEKTIVFFGATYKTGTSTLRDSPLIPIIPLFKKAGAKLLVYDPLVKHGLSDVGFIEIDEAKNADAIVIMTDWDGYKAIDYEQLNPKVLLDTKNILSPLIKRYGIGVKYE